MRTIPVNDDAEQAERDAIKVARSAIRLKYSILADRELNTLLPAIQAKVKKALAEGRPWDMDIKALYAGEDPIS